MVVCSRCQYWEVGSTPDRRECDICRLLHNIVQLSIGGTINLEQERFVAEQLRFFFARRSYLAERHPNLYPGPGHVNDWISQRPLSLVSPSGEARAGPSTTRFSTEEAPAAASKASAPSPPTRPLSRQVQLATHPVGIASHTLYRPYGPFRAWPPSLGHRSPSVARAVVCEASQLPLVISVFLYLLQGRRLLGQDAPIGTSFSTPSTSSQAPSASPALQVLSRQVKLASHPVLR